MLGGCGGVVILDEVGPRFDYFDGDFSYANHKGAIYTDVGSNPFAVPQDRFHDQVLGLMQGQNSGPPATIVAHHTKQTHRPYRVVVLFNADQSIPVHDYCHGTSKVQTVAKTGWTQMYMVFCIGNDLKTHAARYVQGLNGTGDPRFGNLVQGVTLALIPIQDSENKGEDANVP